MKWIMDEHDPDLYDARMRDWYIKAAASPKEIVVLLDTSGSMTGLRKEIAKHVVFNIFETLNENDFVAVYKFSKAPEPLVPCFTDEDGDAEMVQVRPDRLFINIIKRSDFVTRTEPKHKTLAMSGMK